MNRRIVFLHMPKCAGTSLRQAIDSAIVQPCQDSGATVRIETVPSATAAGLMGIDIQDFREQLLLYHMSDPRRRFISGHVSFSERAYRQYRDDWDFITVLRHPVSRWISHYHFNRHKENSHTRITLELEEFIHSERARQLGSEYVRRLSQGLDPYADNGRAAMDMARKNLSRVALVGIVEEIENFCENFHLRYGPRLVLQRLNTNPAPDKIRRVLQDGQILRLIENLCEPDLQIYEAAKKQRVICDR